MNNIDKNKQRLERIDTVNQIIKEIASRGRKFFYSPKTGETAEIIYKNNRLYYKCEHYNRLLCLSVPDYRKPKDWMHGGTMLALVRDFKDYIMGENDTNHKHGYGGLWCPHWGYPEADMVAIRDKAISLTYLKPREQCSTF